MKEETIGSGKDNFISIPFEDIPKKMIKVNYDKFHKKYFAQFLSPTNQYDLYLKLHDSVIQCNDI
jgi:hypothetical protein